MASAVGDALLIGAFPRFLGGLGGWIVRSWTRDRFRDQRERVEAAQARLRFPKRHCAFHHTADSTPSAAFPASSASVYEQWAYLLKTVFGILGWAGPIGYAL